MKYWKVIFTCLILLLWGKTAQFFLHIPLGPDISFKLDENHELQGWPGFLTQYNKEKGYSDVVLWEDENSKAHTLGKIDKFVVSEKYIVVKSEEGWAAIDRNTLKLWRPAETLTNLENQVGTEFADLTFIDEIPMSLVNKHTDFRIKRITTAGIFTALIITAIWILPVIVNRMKKNTETLSK